MTPEQFEALVRMIDARVCMETTLQNFGTHNKGRVDFALERMGTTRDLARKLLVDEMPGEISG